METLKGIAAILAFVLVLGGMMLIAAAIEGV